MKLADGREIITDRLVLGGRYNVYDCPGEAGAGVRVEHLPLGGVRVVEGPASPFGHPLLSLDVDDGVTPFMVTCPDHGLPATSRFYAVAPALELFPVRMVWRKATKGELKRERREGGDHFARGGLAREWVS